jgi:hypothetical protein
LVDSYSFFGVIYKISGGIAQLVERLDGIQKVGGSIPPASTIMLIHSIHYTQAHNNYDQMLDKMLLEMQRISINHLS